jgi:hypothetical protein
MVTLPSLSYIRVVVPENVPSLKASINGLLGSASEGQSYCMAWVECRLCQKTRKLVPSRRGTANRGSLAHLGYHSYKQLGQMQSILDDNGGNDRRCYGDRQPLRCGAILHGLRH